VLRDEPEQAERLTWCTVYKGRFCSGLCLSPSVLQQYVVFSFVRDPVERFWSALSTAATTRAPTYGPTTASGTIAMLEGMQRGQCNVNVHLETQALALTAAVSPDAHKAPSTMHRPPAYMVPLDYIGRIEELRTDFHELLALLHAATGLRLPPARAAALNRSLSTDGRNTRTTANSSACAQHHDKQNEWTRCLEQQLRNATLDALVRKTYAQDVACFG
jgi:hypothetical protein